MSDNEQRKGQKRKLADALSPAVPSGRAEASADGSEAIGQVLQLQFVGRSGMASRQGLALRQACGQVPRLVEHIKSLTDSVGDEAGGKQALRKAVHTLTELAKTGVQLQQQRCAAQSFVRPCLISS